MIDFRRVNKEILEKILDDGLVALPSPPVTVRMPANHPVAQRLRRLFEFYATEEQMSSGLVVQHRREDPEAVALVIRELRQAVVDAGGNPAAIDSLHDEPDPMSYLLANISPMLGGLKL